MTCRKGVGRGMVNRVGGATRVGPLCWQGKPRAGKERLKGCAGCTRWSQKKGILPLVTKARLLKIPGVVNALLCFRVAEWRRPEEDKGDWAPRKRTAWRV